MADIKVVIATDPAKDRLRAVKTKLKAAGGSNKLTQKEIEDTLKDILDRLEID